MPPTGDLCGLELDAHADPSTNRRGHVARWIARADRWDMGRTLVKANRAVIGEQRSKESLTSCKLKMNWRMPNRALKIAGCKKETYRRRQTRLSLLEQQNHWPKNVAAPIVHWTPRCQSYHVSFSIFHIASTPVDTTSCNLLLQRSARLFLLLWLCL
jgi:hypothetical protein